MKKIIVYALPMKFSTGGTEKVIVRLLSYLSQNGYRCIIATTYKQDRPIDLSVEIEFDYILDEKCIKEQDKVLKIDEYFSQFKDIDLTFITFSVNQFTLFIQSNNLIENSNRILFHWHFDYKFSLNTLRLFKLKNYLKYIDNVIVLSKDIERDFKNFGIKNTITIPNPLTYNDIVMPHKKENKVIFVGRYAEIKQPDHIIKAVSNIKNELRNMDEKYTFHLYGPDDSFTRQDLITLTKRMKVSDIVKIEGVRNQDELVEIYKSSKLFLMTSYSEGEGLVLYEALTNSTPVISYDISPIKNNIIIDGYNGKLVEANNIEELSKCILEYLKNNNQIDIFIKNVYEFSKKIIKEKNIDVIGQKWIELFSKSNKNNKNVISVNYNAINPITKQIEYNKPNYDLQLTNSNKGVFIDFNNKNLKKPIFYLSDGISRDLEKEVIKLKSKKEKFSTRVYIPNKYVDSNKCLLVYNNLNQLDVVTTNISTKIYSESSVKISVILITHKSCLNIERAINSILSQSIGFNNIEIIIIEQNIDKESKKIIDYYRKRFDNIRILKQNLDISELKNKAINIANGEYINFLDQEDYLHQHALNNLYGECMIRGLNIVGGYNINYNSLEQKSLCWWYNSFNFDKYLNIEKNDDILHDYINISNFIFRRTFLIHNDIYFKYNKYNNKIFVYESSIKNKEIAIIKKPVVYIYSEKYKTDKGEIEIKDEIEANICIFKMLLDIKHYQCIKNILANRVLYRLINKIVKSKLGYKSMLDLTIKLSELCLLIKRTNDLYKDKCNLSIEINRIYHDLIHQKYELALQKMWYYNNTRLLYLTRVYDIYEDNQNIYLKSVLTFPLLLDNDEELVKNIEVSLFNLETKKDIRLSIRFGEHSYYKYDYNEYNHNSNDNFIIEVPKNNLKEGRYVFRYRVLNSLGRIIISNLGIVRKFGTYINEENLELNFNADENNNISLQVNKTNKNKIKQKINNLVNDIKLLNYCPEYNIEMKLLRLKLSIKPRNKKPKVLIGELPNTYQDSGAVFFEYLKNVNPNFDFYYLTANEELLKSDKKRYIRFNSKKHRRLFITSDIVMNVQNIDDWSNPFYKRNEKYVPKRRKTDKVIFYAFRDFMKNQKRIFMQHGVLYHSGLTNSIFINSDFDSLIVSTEFEKKVFPPDGREFIECILPRYSNYKKQDNNNGIKKILFSPTWRNYLKDFKSGGVKEEELLGSEYYKNIIEFICDSKLTRLLEDNNIEMYVNIHHTMIEFINGKIKNLNLSKNIKINDGTISVNKLIQQCDMCITDYSSLFFDFIYQNKIVIHYLFDYEDYYTRPDNNKKSNDIFKLKEYEGCIYAENSESLIEKINLVVNNKIDVNYNCEFFNVKDPCEEYLKYINKYLEGKK